MSKSPSMFFDVRVDEVRAIVKNTFDVIDEDKYHLERMTN